MAFTNKIIIALMQFGGIFILGFSIYFFNRAELVKDYSLATTILIISLSLIIYGQILQRKLDKASLDDSSDEKINVNYATTKFATIIFYIFAIPIILYISLLFLAIFL